MAIFACPILTALLLLNGAMTNSPELPKDVRDKIDEIISGAYQSASAQFPCKIGTGGRLRMMQWSKVDACLNAAAGRVDWQGVSKQLEALRLPPVSFSINEFAAAVEASLSAHALTFDKVLAVKDERALLPLTNSLLKFLPADSLHDLPVFDRTGTAVGTFSGIYPYERQGGLASANVYRLMLFQYTDKTGNVQSASEKLLLDSFGVPWKEARTQPGFRLSGDNLELKR
jgi:hypothetical protein